MKEIHNNSVKVISIGNKVVLPDDFIVVEDKEINESVRILSKMKFIEIVDCKEEIPKEESVVIEDANSSEYPKQDIHDNKIEKKKKSSVKTKATKRTVKKAK